MPDGATGDVPLVIMAGGWCYTKEIVMPHYSRFFNDIGCATLRFDYRCFGESTGLPRQHINPWEQIEDYRNALTYAEGLKGIDHKRTGIWGISYSGGHVLVVAGIDSRPAFAISTIPVFRQCADAMAKPASQNSTLLSMKIEQIVLLGQRLPTCPCRQKRRVRN